MTNLDQIFNWIEITQGMLHLNAAIFNQRQGKELLALK